MSSARLNVYHIGTRGIPTTQGGIERHIEEIATRQTDSLDITVYARTYYVKPMTEYRGVKIHRLKTVQSKHFDTWIYSLVATLNVLFKPKGIVHFHALGPSIFAWLPRLFGHKTVVTVHGLDWQRAKWNWIARFYLKMCEIFSAKFPNKTIVVSKVLAEYYYTKFGKTVSSIPNGISKPKVVEPNEITQKWGLEKDGYIFFIARLSQEKGAHHLIKAFRNLDTDKKLVISGEGLHSDKYESELRELASGDDRIIFTGFVTGSTIDELFGNCYLYCQPSEIEGLSIAMLEAMSYGCCVLSSDIPENLELIEGVGHKFESKNIESLTNELEKLLKNHDLVTDAGEKAQHRALNEYSWDQVAKLTEKLYRKLSA
jgi:glycosyltransferase involved in cell wall biosynthesis